MRILLHPVSVAQEQEFDRVMGVNFMQLHITSLQLRNPESVFRFIQKMFSAISPMILFLRFLT